MFIATALGIACGNDKVCRNILSYLMDDLIEKYQHAISKVDFFLEVERDGMPMTLNHYLNNNLQRKSLNLTPVIRRP